MLRADTAVSDGHSCSSRIGLIRRRFRLSRLRFRRRGLLAVLTPRGDQRDFPVGSPSKSQPCQRLPRIAARGARRADRLPSPNPESQAVVRHGLGCLGDVVPPYRIRQIWLSASRWSQYINPVDAASIQYPATGICPRLLRCDRCLLVWACFRLPPVVHDIAGLRQVFAGTLDRRDPIPKNTPSGVFEGICCRTVCLGYPMRQVGHAKRR